MAPSWSTKAEKAPLLPLTAQDQPTAAKRTVTIYLSRALIGEIEHALDVDIDDKAIEIAAPSRPRDSTRRTSGKMFVLSAPEPVDESSITEHVLLAISFCVILLAGVWATAVALTLALDLPVDIFGDDFLGFTFLLGSVMAACFALIAIKKANGEPVTPFLMWSAFREVGRVLVSIGGLLVAVAVTGQLIVDSVLMPVVSKLVL
ncbi:hypothetical protein BDY17DRAFT_320110 [Neohortaea acidophila]|uniref:Uncharacterized protein n=1 Tax=Neohortaea acidophila TaxID=245834 RepID=A0A6A6Q6B1_9PEZI|nr:uncharacterized protein BDY17DRAFT_320110 [Neohortaea acidophila]KAF2487579.1 hypothetical protein BDY17DRAFT_320110 [Neohortaea acidophila]